MTATMAGARGEVDMGEVAHAARDREIDISLVEAPDGTLHLERCFHVRGAATRPQRLALEVVDRVPMCSWCLEEMRTPSLATIIHLAADLDRFVAALTDHAAVSSAMHLDPVVADAATDGSPGRLGPALAVAVLGLRQCHEGVRPEFHPSLASLGIGLHEANGLGLERIEAALAPSAPAGAAIHRSALLVALAEATAAVAVGLAEAIEPWGRWTREIIAAAPIDPELLVRVLVAIADREALQGIARPSCLPEWTRIPDPPTDTAAGLLACLGLRRGSLEALAAEVALADLVDVMAAAAADPDALEVGSTGHLVVEHGIVLGSDARRLAWRRGRVHWLRGLVDLGLVGDTLDAGDAVEPDALLDARTVIPGAMRQLQRPGARHRLQHSGAAGADAAGGRLVEVPGIVAAALQLPRSVAGSSPVRAADHRVPGPDR